MKRGLITILLALAAPGAFAQEVSGSVDVLSDKWFAGPHLIYDCSDRHWVCASELDRAQCLEERGLRLARGARLLACSVGESFKTKEACWERQRELLHQGHYPRTCLHPSARKRFIGFQ